MAAILDCLGSAGFEAKHLASWSAGDDIRSAFEARKIDGKPREWEHGSYEGMSFQKNADGGCTWVWHDPKHLSLEAFFKATRALSDGWLLSLGPEICGQNHDSGTLI